MPSQALIELRQQIERKAQELKKKLKSIVDGAKKDREKNDRLTLAEKLENFNKQIGLLKLNPDEQTKFLDQNLWNFLDRIPRDKFGQNFQHIKEIRQNQIQEPNIIRTLIEIHLKLFHNKLVDSNSPIAQRIADIKTAAITNDLIIRKYLPSLDSPSVVDLAELYPAQMEEVTHLAIELDELEKMAQSQTIKDIQDALVEARKTGHLDYQANRAEIFSLLHLADSKKFPENNIITKITLRIRELDDSLIGQIVDFLRENRQVVEFTPVFPEGTSDELKRGSTLTLRLIQDKIIANQGHRDGVQSGSQAAAPTVSPHKTVASADTNTTKPGVSAPAPAPVAMPAEATKENKIDPEEIAKINRKVAAAQDTIGSLVYSGSKKVLKELLEKASIITNEKNRNIKKISLDFHEQPDTDIHNYIINRYLKQNPQVTQFVVTFPQSSNQQTLEKQKNLVNAINAHLKLKIEQEKEQQKKQKEQEKFEAAYCIFKSLYKPQRLFTWEEENTVVSRKNNTIQEISLFLISEGEKLGHEKLFTKSTFLFNRCFTQWTQENANKIRAIDERARQLTTKIKNKILGYNGEAGLDGKLSGFTFGTTYREYQGENNYHEKKYKLADGAKNMVQKLMELESPENEDPHKYIKFASYCINLAKRKKSEHEAAHNRCCNFTFFPKSTEALGLYQWIAERENYFISGQPVVKAPAALSSSPAPG